MWSVWCTGKLSLPSFPHTCQHTPTPPSSTIKHQFFGHQSLLYPFPGHGSPHPYCCWQFCRLLQRTGAQCWCHCWSPDFLNNKLQKKLEAKEMKREAQTIEDKWEMRKAILAKEALIESVCSTTKVSRRQTIEGKAICNHQVSHSSWSNIGSVAYRIIPLDKNV